MAVATLRKVNGIILLNNGTTASGGVKTVSIRVGGTSQDISGSNYNEDLTASRTKLLAIVSALSPCLSKSVYSVNEEVTNQISAS